MAVNSKNPACEATITVLMPSDIVKSNTALLALLTIYHSRYKLLNASERACSVFVFVCFCFT